VDPDRADEDHARRRPHFCSAPYLPVPILDCGRPAHICETSRYCDTGENDGDHKIDMPGHQILICRAAAAIEHKLELCAGEVLEVDTADVPRCRFRRLQRMLDSDPPSTTRSVP
jgi:hypothetical protein